MKTYIGKAKEPKEETNQSVDQLREQLYKICDETKTSRSGMDYLVNYYQENLGWSEKAALEYAILLFHNGTIQQIKLIGKDGEEL